MFEPEKLREARAAKAMSRDALAAEMRRISDVKASARGIAFWEDGLHTPRSDVLPVIARALGVDVSALFTDDGAASEDDEEGAAQVTVTTTTFTGPPELVAALMERLRENPAPVPV